MSRRNRYPKVSRQRTDHDIVLEAEMLIDAHAHIDQYKDDLPEAIAQIENEPILMLLNSKFLSTLVK
jgi:hypothetical protein